MKTVDSEAAFELMFELLKAHPWLNKPGTMRPGDESAEQEAVAFLLAGDTSRQWAGCSAAAQRVANTLLIDFMHKLRSPEGPISESSWQVDERQRAWRQALSVVASEIRKTNPRLGARH